MSSFLSFVSNPANNAMDHVTIEHASRCLEQFTAAFNAQDFAAMDAQLHFPHVMLSTSETLLWDKSNQHPADFFEQLKKTGWATTQYESIVPVLASKEKVHFLLVYTRRSSTGEELSRHTNLWIVINKEDRWGISLRSY